MLEEELDKICLDETRKNLLNKFQGDFGIIFSDLRLLHLAFVHRSCGLKFKSCNLNNERLEFLGDSILGAVCASRIFMIFPDKAEGDLAKIKSAVVSEPVLNEVALKYGFDKLLVLGKGEENTGGRFKKAILADCVEAFIGAVFIDKGFEACEKVILSFLDQHIKNYLTGTEARDYKSELQVLEQKKYGLCPRYITTSVEGPDHDRVFWVKVILGGGREIGPVSGKSKKNAEQMAAKKALKSLGI